MKRDRFSPVLTLILVLLIAPLVWAGLYFLTPASPFGIFPQFSEFSTFHFTRARIADGDLDIATRERPGVITTVAEEKAFNDYDWGERPFVVLDVEPVDWTRKVTLLWAPGETSPPGIGIQLTIPSGAERVVADPMAPILWKPPILWEADSMGRPPVDRVGLMVPPHTTLKLRSFYLTSRLAFSDWAHLMWRDFLRIEPITSKSINFRFGSRLSGRSLNLVLGFAAAVLIVGLFSWGRRGVPWAVLGVVVLAGVGSLPAWVALVDQAGYGAGRSAWREGIREERASRFGVDFAALMEAVEREVPPGARVAVPKPRDERMAWETNWAWFQLVPRWAAYGRDGVRREVVQKGDFVMLFHPASWSYDPVSRRLADGRGGEVKAAGIWAKSAQVMLVRVIE